MTGPYLQILGVLPHLAQRAVKRPSRRFHGASDIRGALEQVGAPNVADENEVSAEDAQRPIRGRAVGDEEDEVLRRVAGHVAHVEANLPDGERVAVAEQFGTIRRADAVLPVAIALGGEQQPSPRTPNELTRSGEKVGVNMRLGDVRNTEPLARRGNAIRFDVARRIDHERLVGRFCAHEIARLRECLVVEALQEHGRVIACRRWTAAERQRGEQSQRGSDITRTPPCRRESTRRHAAAPAARHSARDGFRQRSPRSQSP